MAITLLKHNITMYRFSELYKDALDNVSAFNARLCYERKMRVPFLDAQTGIAMMSSHLWLSKLMRRPGCTPHYVYSYPARRWRKRKKGSEPPRGVAEEERMADKHGNNCFSIYNTSLIAVPKWLLYFTTKGGSRAIFPPETARR